MAKVKEAVIFIEKDKLEVFEADTGKIFPFAFPANSIVDYEVADEDMLTGFVAQFFQKNKLSFAQYVIILGSSLLFQNDFSLKPPEKVASEQPNNPQPQPTQTPQPSLTKEALEEQKKHFLDIIPFQNVIATEVPLNKGEKIIASNKDICTIVSKALTASGATLRGIFPVTVFTNEQQPPTSLTPDLAHKALKIDSWKQFNMVNEEQASIQAASQKDMTQKRNKKDIGLIGVFIVLVLILGGMLVPMFLHSEKPTKPPVLVVNSSPTPSSTSVGVASVPDASVSAVLQNTTFTGEVTYISSDIQTAQSVQQALEKAGVKNVLLQPMATTSAQTIMQLSPRVDSASQTTLTNILKQFVSNPIVQRNNTTVTDITIIIGQ